MAIPSKADCVDAAARGHDSRPIFGRWRRLRWTPLLGLLLTVLLVDVAIATFLEVREEESAGLVIGSAFAQIVASAVWMTLGPAKIFTRLIGGTMACGVATMSMFMCALRDAGDDMFAVAIAVAMFVQWLLYQAPLWMARMRGWRLAWPGAATNESRMGESQFGIRQLMVWTATVAVIFAAARIVAPEALADGDRLEVSREVAVFFAASLFNSVLAFPVVWGCFVRRRCWLWLIIAAGWCALLTPLELYLVTYAMGATGPGGAMEFFIMINAGQFIAVAAILLAARLAGFRLQHSAKEQ